MGKLQWSLARLTDRVGLSGWIAWLLLITISVYGYYVFFPAQQRLVSLEKTLAEMPRVPYTIDTYKSPAEQFFSQIPQVTELTSNIQTVFNVAEKNQIVINEVVYKDEQKPGEMVVRYTMNFSVVAEYPEIKAFIVNTLAELSSVALEQLTFERVEEHSNIVSAHLRFTLYMVQP